jgi:hypothetical protein
MEDQNGPTTVWAIKTSKRFSCVKFDNLNLDCSSVNT